MNQALSHAPHDLVIARIRAHMAARPPAKLTMDGFRLAAVAVLLSDCDGVTHVTLTRRAATLRAHSGQVSLPGGVRDPDDDSFAATALRECQEEIGVPPSNLHVLGMLDDELTTSGFIITPVVAELAAAPRYVVNPAEVARVFEVPLAAFADRATARELGQRSIAGITYPVRVYRHGDHEVTGATARILERLGDIVRTAYPPGNP